MSCFLHIQTNKQISFDGDQMNSKQWLYFLQPLLILLLPPCLFWWIAAHHWRCSTAVVLLLVVFRNFGQLVDDKTFLAYKIFRKRNGIRTYSCYEKQPKYSHGLLSNRLFANTENNLYIFENKADKLEWDYTYLFFQINTKETHREEVIESGLYLHRA